jgi:hypothetical protein
MRAPVTRCHRTSHPAHELAIAHEASGRRVHAPERCRHRLHHTMVREEPRRDLHAPCLSVPTLGNGPFDERGGGRSSAAIDATSAGHSSRRNSTTLQPGRARTLPPALEVVDGRLWWFIANWAVPILGPPLFILGIRGLAALPTIGGGKGGGTPVRWPKLDESLDVAGWLPARPPGRRRQEP